MELLAVFLVLHVSVIAGATVLGDFSNFTFLSFSLSFGLALCISFGTAEGVVAMVCGVRSAMCAWQ